MNSFHIIFNHKSFTVGNSDVQIPVVPVIFEKISICGFNHDGTSWSIQEYGSKDNAFSLCTFIGA